MLGRRQKQARAFKAYERRHLIESVEERLLGLRQMRDLTMTLVAYDSMARRSELVAVRVEDITASGDTGVLLIRKSKTDQEGQGSKRFLGPDTIAVLQEWLRRAGIAEGFVFRAVRRGGKKNPHGHVSADPEKHVTPLEWARAVRRMAELAGVRDPETYSGHSTRVGAAQDQREQGIEVGKIMASGGWKSMTMVARYTEDSAVAEGGMADLARRQGRRSIRLR
ncbi:tyrosine-type recombinase/integrase [Azospirillum brasilense]|uniref:Tyr recombinase domain-containing protein n=1 Tax=Azospirillum brasilense TaxID=192 RepID=A0A6L3ARH4_AZOBR|nr:tyrosine-type recombinase/integrase [Azospirillum brasilense]KAA0676746.1 hypothetical protein DS837_30420 [Azospirillum brasilense]